MKYINLILIVSFLLSCSTDEQNGQTKPVIVSQVVVPEFAKVDEIVPVYVKAYAPNGCWSNLTVSLTKSKDFHYEINAKGFYNGNSICPEIYEEKDTVINMTFSTAGKYCFEANKAPFLIEHDTITVNN